MKKKLKIGLVGYGNAGKGFVQQLRASCQSFHLAKVAVKSPGLLREGLDDSILTTDWRDLTDDASLDVIVEAITEVDAAFQIARSALKSGKHVVTANKQLVVQHHKELNALAVKKGLSFLYEASCGAGIPLIRMCEQYYSQCQVNGFKASLNGTCNYVLDRVDRCGFSPAQALKEAQDLGYAERDAGFDLSGKDAEAKLRILCYHLFGAAPERLHVVRSGIENLDLAERYGLHIKGLRLIAKVSHTLGQLQASVLPEMLSEQDPLIRLQGPLNGLDLELQGGERQFISGSGAGSLSTGIGLFQDVLAVSRGFRYRSSTENFELEEHKGLLNLRILSPTSENLPKSFFSRIRNIGERNSVRCVDAIIERRWFHQLQWDRSFVLDITGLGRSELSEKSLSFSA